jgi:HlyD family secretion protein
MEQVSKGHEVSLRRHLLGGLSVLVLLGGGVGGWAATTELSGAVVAPGILVVDSHVKKVQHPTGGVVGEIRVRDGDRVNAGDLVVRLDETIARANLAVITKSLDEFAAQQGRLEAERDQEPSIEIHAELRSRSTEPEIADLIAGEQRLFDLRREARKGLRSQLEQRIGQLQEQVVGLQEQAGAKDEEIRLIRDELVGVQELWRKNLVPVSRVTALRREETRLKGERGQLTANIAQTHGRVSETDLQIIQIDQELRSEVAKELREIQAKTAELIERRIAAEDQLKRIDIRAPQAGIVHQLAAHTIGGVIEAGVPLMLIVPEADDLAIEVNVRQQDIDQMTIGQDVVLRLSAFNQRTTPEIKGKVSRIAADLTQDQKTGAAFYTARVMPSENELTRLKDLKLIPGMPVEAFVQTGDRTALSYLVKPLSDQLNRAWREE